MPPQIRPFSILFYVKTIKIFQKLELFHVLTKFYYFNTVNTYLTALLSSFLQNSNASINNLNKNFCKQCFALYKRNFTRNLVSEYIV